MNSTILSTLFPTTFKTLYWFLNGTYEFFMQETFFVDGDLIVIDLYHHYFSGVNVLDDLHTLLVRLDERGVKWLIYIPDSHIAKELFSLYNIYPVQGQNHRNKIPALYISNYSV